MIPNNFFTSQEVNQTNAPLANVAKEEFSPMDRLPEEIILTIFANVKTDLSALSSVSRQLKLRTDKIYEWMFKEIEPLVFGKIKLKKYFPVQELGAEVIPRLPLQVYEDLKKGLCLVTYIPEQIFVQDEKGNVIDSSPSAGIIGKLVENPVNGGHKTCFEKGSLFHYIDEPRKMRYGYWDVIYKESFYKGLDYKIQEKNALEKWKGADVVPFDPAIYAVFMHYVETGERCFPRDETSDNNTWVRTKDVNKIGGRLVFGFGPSGLRVSSTHNCGFDHIGVAVSRNDICLKEA